MESLTREPVSMTSATPPSSVNGNGLAGITSTTTGPGQTKVQFADNLINNKPGSASVPTIPNNSSVTTTTTTAPAAPTPNSTPIVNSSIKPTNNLTSTVNPLQTSAVNCSLNSTGNPPQTQSATSPQINSSTGSNGNNSTTAASNTVTTTSAITNPTVSSEASASANVKAPATITATSIPAPKNIASTATTNTTCITTTSSSPSPTPPAPINGQTPLKKDIIGNQEISAPANNMNSNEGFGKSEDLNGSVSKDSKTVTETNNMNGSMSKGIYSTGSSQSQDRNAAASKQYVAPDVVGRDVQKFCEKIEKSGLCAPADKDSFPGNIASVLSTPPAARPNTAESVVGNSPNKPSPGKFAKVGSGGGTSASGTAKAPATTATTREPRPSTATPKAGTGALKTGSGSTPVASRTSTARAASAKVSPTSPNSKNISNGKSSTPTAATNGNGHYDEKSRAKSAPKLRPTSSLYKPTASSALKGIATSPTVKASKSLSGPNNDKASKPKMGDAAGNGGSGEGKSATLKEQFAVFSRFGDTSSDGKHITLTNCDKWMKQAHVIDGKKITTTDTSIAFKKLFKTAKKVGFEDFKKYVEELATNKKIEPQEILDKLTNCGAPGLSSATRASGGGVYERLTDTSRYTGSHKERFDATGKGRGIEGRRDIQDDSGYTASFKSKLADGNSPAK